MPRGPDESADLRLVHELVFEPHSLELARFDPEETKRGPTPDFRVYQDGALVAYCEVKSPRDDWLNNKLDHAVPGELVGGLRPDPVFNRIARHVNKAALQFDAVNEKREVPNVLVLLNHDDQSSVADLVEALTGQFESDDGTRHPTMLHLARNVIGESATKIDMYIWIDAGSRTRYFRTNSYSPHREMVRGLFGLA